MGLGAARSLQFPTALFSIVTAYGLLRLHGWGWWCGVIWATLAVPVILLSSLWIMSHFSWNIVSFIWLLAMISLPLILLIWPLVTRRQLFFPPKQEGEE